MCGVVCVVWLVVCVCLGVCVVCVVCVFVCVWLCVLVGSVVEHCIISAKGCGIHSQGIEMYSLNAL